MKIGIIIFTSILIALLLFILLKRSHDSTISVGSIDDIERNMLALMTSGKEGAFLIVTVQGTNDFIQFTSDASSVQLDFPLVTERQKSLEMIFRSAAKGLDLEIVENRGSGGEIFLDITMKGTAAEIAVIARALMEKLFTINQGVKIQYELDA